VKLQDSLKPLTGDPQLLLGPHVTLRRGDLLALSEGTPNAATGLRLGLRYSDPAEILPLLMALDGQAAALAFFSTTTAPEDLPRLAKLCALDAILTAEPDALAAISDLPPVTKHWDDLRPLSKGSTPAKTEWILMTSGTTGLPKPVAHDLCSLTRTTKFSQAAASIRWGMLYDFTRFAGMQVLLQSLLSGATLLAPLYGDRLDSKLGFFAANGCTHISATPSLWRKILMSPEIDHLSLRQITLGGEIADQKILTALRDKFPTARLSHIFASTEAGVGFAVSDGLEGFPASYLETPPAGIELKLSGQRLFVRNSAVKASYLGSEQSFADASGWVDTGDDVSLHNDRVHFLGRASGVINIGGDKVHPEDVERALLAHPFVAVVRVYAKSNPITGQLVAADIVLSAQAGEPNAAKSALMSFCRETLGRTKAPALLRIVPELAMNEGGKLARTMS
jgi:acyl-CoA synthetase (AMP-forming)/AMP-acid ligase II